MIIFVPDESDIHGFFASIEDKDVAKMKNPYGPRFPYEAEVKRMKILTPPNLEFSESAILICRHATAKEVARLKIDGII